MKKRPPNKKPGAARAGVLDFVDTMFAGHPCWSLIAVRAEARYVTRSFSEQRHIVRWDRGVPIKPAGKFAPVPRFTAFVEVVDNPWTIVLRSVFTVSKEEFTAIPQEVCAFSRRIKTQAISFIGEDTADTFSYEIFDEGKEIEKASWTRGGGFDLFSSKVRKCPRLDGIGVEFADEVFRSHGIYVPACYPQQQDDGICLAVEERSAGTVQRADLIEIGKVATPKLDEIVATMIRNANERMKKGK